MKKGLPVTVFFACIFCYGKWCMKKKDTMIETITQINNKLQDNYFLLNHWMEVKQEGKSAASYFMESGYRQIAVYGMAELANRLAEDLAGSEVVLKYGIDRNVCCTSSRMSEIYSMEDKLPEADVIVVTPFYAFESIKAELEKKVRCPIISIEDVVWGV